MDYIRKILKWVFRAMAIICFVVLAKYYPILWLIIGVLLIIIVVAIVVFIVYVIDDSTGDRYMKRKFGNDFQKAIDSGQLSYTKAYPCVPEEHYTSKRSIEEKCNIEIPDFEVKECRETLTDFTGDYRGCADIEFLNNIDIRTIQQIEDDMKKSFSKWRKENEEYICNLEEPNLQVSPSQDVFWQLIIKKESTKGKIVYGRI